MSFYYLPAGVGDFDIVGRMRVEDEGPGLAGVVQGAECFGINRRGPEPMSAARVCRESVRGEVDGGR